LAPDAISPPQMPYVQEFAEAVYGSLRVSGNDSEEILRQIGSTVNSFYARTLSYTPSVKHAFNHSLTALASAGRDVRWAGKFLREEDGVVRWDTSEGTQAEESFIANAVAHESVHVEQRAIVYRRLADQLQIGREATPEQMKELIINHPQEGARAYFRDNMREESASMSGDLGTFTTAKNTAEAVIKERAGEVLLPEQAERADRLIESFKRIKSTAPRTNALYTYAVKAREMISSQAAPTSDDQFAVFYKRVTATPVEIIPAGMRHYVSKMENMRGLVQPTPTDSDMGRLFYRAFKGHEFAAYSQHQLLGYKPYRALFHEEEAWKFGNAVEAKYNSESFKQEMSAKEAEKAASLAATRSATRSARQVFSKTDSESEFIEAAKKLGFEHRALNDGSWELTSGPGIKNIVLPQTKIVRHADGTVERSIGHGRPVQTFYPNGKIVEAKPTSDGGDTYTYHSNGQTRTITSADGLTTTDEDFYPPPKWPWLEKLHAS